MLWNLIKEKLGLPVTDPGRASGQDLGLVPVPNKVVLHEPPIVYQVIPPTSGNRAPDYGRAVLHTQGQDDLSPVFADGGSSCIVLGDGCVWDLVKQQGHALSFGATRTGKGTSAIIGAFLSYSGPMLGFDPKGENAWITAEHRRKMGHRVVILDPWNEVNKFGHGDKPGPVETVEQVTRFNPLSALDANDPNFADDVAFLADALIIPGTGDSHWSDSARELVAGLIAAEVLRNPGVASLGAIRRQISAGFESIAKFADVIVDQYPDSVAAAKLQGFTTPTNEIKSICNVTRTQTAFLDSPVLQDAMETDETPFDMAELATGQTTVYLVLPAERLSTHARWMRLILTLAIRSLARQPRRKPLLPCLLLLDEMGTALGPLAMLARNYGLMAGMGIRLWGFLQDLPQLKTDYPNIWGTFISNTSIIQILNATEETTINYFSNKLGKTTYEQLSEHTIARRKGWIRPQPRMPEDEITNAITAEEMEINAKLNAARERDRTIRPSFKSFHGISEYDTLIRRGLRYHHPRLPKQRTILKWEPDPNYFRTSQHPKDRTMEGFTSTDDQAWERPLMLPQEIAGIASDQVLVIYPGQGNYLVKRVVYFEQRGFKGKYRNHPEHPEPANDPTEPEANPDEPTESPFDEADLNGFMVRLRRNAAFVGKPLLPVDHPEAIFVINDFADSIQRWMKLSLSIEAIEEILKKKLVESAKADPGAWREFRGK